jgi:hypothetical protein
MAKQQNEYRTAMEFLKDEVVVEKKKSKRKNEKSKIDKKEKNEKEKKNPIDKTSLQSQPPVACLNDIGYFPSREQMIYRIVLWAGACRGSSQEAHVVKEIMELADILRAELWIEQVWQERGGFLSTGDVLIGIFPDEEIKKFDMNNSTSLVCSSTPKQSTSDQLMLCRFVGAKRNGLLVEIGVHCEPIFLTWKQAIPLTDKWRDFIKSGTPQHVMQLVSSDTVVVQEYTWDRVRNVADGEGQTRTKE